MSLGSRLAAAGRAVLGLTDAPPPVASAAATTDAASARSFMQSAADAVSNLFAGRFYEGQEHVSNLLDGGWEPRAPYTDIVIEMLGRTGLARRVLALRALDATREGWRVRFPKIADPAEAGNAAGRLEMQQQRISTQATFYRALFKAEQWGESIIVIGADDGQALDQPLDMTRIQRVRWLKVFSRPDYNPGPLSPPEDDNFGKPQSYEIFDFGKPDLASLERAPRVVMSAVVHHSRVLRFATEDGHSRLDEVGQALEDYFAATRSGRKAASVFSVAVYAIKDWISKVVENEKAAVNRIALQHLALKKLGALVIDKENEGYSYQTAPSGGLADLIDRAATALCAWTGYPAMILFGLDPAGFASGEEVIRRYYDGVRVVQKLQVQPPLRRLLEILMVSEDGPKGIIVEPDDWGVYFLPLRTLSAQEQAELREIVYRGLATLKAAQLIDREEGRASLTRDDGELVPELRLSKEAAEEKRERMEVGIVTAISQAILAFYTAQGRTPPALAMQTALAALVPEFTDAALLSFTDPPASDTPAVDEEIDAGEDPLPTPGMPPADEPLVSASVLRTRFGVGLAGLKAMVARGEIRGWKPGGRWGFLASEVASSSYRPPPPAEPAPSTPVP